MVRALRQYGRWLRDNYADLEHKEVWQSFVVLAIILLMFVVYALTNENQIFIYVMLVISAVFICYLLWRVETLSDLSIPIQTDEAIPVVGAEETDTTEKVEDNALPLTMRNNIGPLLKQYCEEPQLYLQYDLTLSQLANLIGTNRLYLSQHFSSLGMTYNSYINGLRIQYFINLYHEAVANHQPIMVQQLAFKSGFRSYNTFNVAFKKIMGMNTTEWIRNQIST
jgi:AraC-like DNA-binding protein